MKIAIACDHGAYDYKMEIKKMLEEEGHEVIDCGCDSDASVDYPDYGSACARKVAAGEVDTGIVMCGTGIGISISANKIKGIRCALCTDTTMARLTREHNDANMLAMGQRTGGLATSSRRSLASCVHGTMARKSSKAGRQRLTNAMKGTTLGQSMSLKGTLRLMAHHMTSPAKRPSSRTSV